MGKKVAPGTFKTVVTAVITSSLLYVGAPLLVDYCKRPAVIERFEVDPPKIEEGQSATLKWQTRGATEVYIAPPRSPVPTTGTLPVHPERDTEYQIEALNRFQEPRGSIAKLIVVARPVVTSTTSSTTAVSSSSSTNTFVPTSTSTSQTATGATSTSVTSSTSTTSSTERPMVEIGVREYGGEVLYRDWDCNRTEAGEVTFRIPPNEKFVSASWELIEVAAAKSYLLPPPMYREDDRTVVARDSFTGLDRVAFISCPEGGHARFRLKVVTREWP